MEAGHVHPHDPRDRQMAWLRAQRIRDLDTIAGQADELIVARARITLLEREKTILILQARRDKP